MADSAGCSRTSSNVSASRISNSASVANLAAPYTTPGCKPESGIAAGILCVRPLRPRDPAGDDIHLKRIDLGSRGRLHPVHFCEIAPAIAQHDAPSSAPQQFDGRLPRHPPTRPWPEFECRLRQSRTPQNDRLPRARSRTHPYRLAQGRHAPPERARTTSCVSASSKITEQGIYTAKPIKLEQVDRDDHAPPDRYAPPRPDTTRPGPRLRSTHPPILSDQSILIVDGHQLERTRDFDSRGASPLAHIRIVELALKPA